VADSEHGPRLALTTSMHREVSRLSLMRAASPSRKGRRNSTIVAIALLSAGCLATGARAQDPVVEVTVDVTAGRHAISPLIYGVSKTSAENLAALNAPMTRLGGNYTSRYNWQANAYNRAVDWFFESVPETGETPGASADAFITDARSAGAQPLVTVPMLDWVARLGDRRSRLASFSVARYGAQTSTDAQWYQDAGNGVLAGGTPVRGNDPADANTRAGVRFQQAWVRHLVSTWRGAADGGVRYYVADNEPSLWHSTHRDVHPAGATMDEVATRLIEYAEGIKAVDPGAKVVGPEEWGWLGFLYSGHDQQFADQWGWRATLPDRMSHGGQDYLPWLLDRLRQRGVATGRWPLDVISVHYYPEGGEHSNDTSTAMQLRRNRSTRSLWDPSYVDQSWIDARVQLIPRLRGWIDTHYVPGTPMAITEYSWGADRHISGALAQADVLGIFGREGVSMAARWQAPAPDTPTFKAIQMYRNYDGRKSTFGDMSVRVTGGDPDTLAVFAAERSEDGALTVMAINKSLSGPTPLQVNLPRLATSGVAERWELTAGGGIRRREDVRTHDGLSAILPQQSITLLVLRPGGPAATQSLRDR
jgi:Glycoside hydrolase family 44